MRPPCIPIDARCRRRRDRGLTLVELLVTLAILAILAGTAAPAFVGTIARQRLEGSLTTLALDLQFTRSEAIRRRTTATLTTSADGTAYTVSYTPEGRPEQVVKTITMPAHTTLSPSLAIAFDGLRGFAQTQTITASSTRTGAVLHALTNETGRVQACAVDGSIKGYPVC